MRRRFRLSPSGGAPHDPWFHIGTLEVGTAVGIALLSAVAMLFGAITMTTPIPMSLMMDSSEVAHGEVWRVFTWPLGYPGGVSFSGVLVIAMLWYFGKDLEDNLLGRKRMLQLIAGATVLFGVTAVAIYAAFGQPVFDATLRTIELVVLLAWVAEWPNRRFLFNIPAWVVGLVIFALSVIEPLQYGGWPFALYLVVGLALCAVLAKSLGMLSEHHIVPHISRPRRTQKHPRRGHRHPSQGPRVVAGPWEGSAAAPHNESKDEARMNALLEKIHASGHDSLTAKEKAELLELRDRLRKR